MFLKKKKLTVVQDFNLVLKLQNIVKCFPKLEYIFKLLLMILNSLSGYIIYDRTTLGYQRKLTTLNWQV